MANHCIVLFCDGGASGQEPLSDPRRGKRVIRCLLESWLGLSFRRGDQLTDLFVRLRPDLQFGQGVEGHAFGCIAGYVDRKTAVKIGLGRRVELDSEIFPLTGLDRDGSRFYRQARAACLDAPDRHWLRAVVDDRELRSRLLASAQHSKRYRVRGDLERKMLTRRIRRIQGGGGYDSALMSREWRGRRQRECTLAARRPRSSNDCDERLRSMQPSTGPPTGTDQNPNTRDILLSVGWICQGPSFFFRQRNRLGEPTPGSTVVLPSVCYHSQAGPPPNRCRRPAIQSSKSEGNGASTRRPWPVNGWMNPRASACSACRENGNGNGPRSDGR